MDADIDLTTSKTISLRLTNDEARRLSKLLAIADAKTLGFAPHTQVLKELLGLLPYRLMDAELRESLLKDDGEKKGRKRKAV